MTDDKLMQAAQQLATDVTPERDLWPDIARAIAPEAPQQRRGIPMFAQAAAVVLLIAGSSGLTYLTMKDMPRETVIASPDMVFEQVSFGNNYSLGADFQSARNELVGELATELERLSPEAAADIQDNLSLLRGEINKMNDALEEDPENIVLQKQLLRMYRDELALLQRVSSLSQNVMMRNDI